ncbi:EAL domain-containing protein [Lelliottia sp. CFBP8978]|uniref:EAL domain-containing protein n=1 Tax=Lelliottia sp. CFBP8978 TaxID=3096522 RepID=UPI002A6B45C7|nr:EAL domain-containing protein [Lelliottia sp. CFBP8978]MDY1036681.1 EAL domain-containing protein [Lelliottia sp. CFBP8978]
MKNTSASPFTSELTESDIARLQNVSREIVGVKLEPIVALSSSSIIGMELLSLLDCPAQSEAFFHHQPANQSVRLLEAQFAALKNTPWRKNLFINLSINMLSETEPFTRFLPLITPGQNIEIVDPGSFFLLPARLRERVTQHLWELSDRGCCLWLDDVDKTLINQFLPCRLPLSGVKIDKMAFWRKRATPALAQLVSQCEQVADNVLIEGIESHRDREYALQAGAGFGQGFYWPSIGWAKGRRISA